MHHGNSRLSIRPLIIIMVVILAIAGVIIGLTVATSHTASGTSGNVGSASWAAVCQKAAANGSSTYKATDENGNRATVTYCGFTFGNVADGQTAEAGDTYVDTVFLTTANQAASFDPNSILVVANSTVDAYVGDEANCGNGNENTAGCPEMADYGGDMSTAGYATSVLGDLPPVYQGHPQLIVLSTQMPEQNANGQMRVIIAETEPNGIASLVTLNSAGKQSLPVNWSL